jgi:hypothetical protein
MAVVIRHGRQKRSVRRRCLAGPPGASQCVLQRPRAIGAAAPVFCGVEAWWSLSQSCPRRARCTPPSDARPHAYCVDTDARQLLCGVLFATSTDGAEAPSVPGKSARSMAPTDQVRICPNQLYQDPPIHLLCGYALLLYAGPVDAVRNPRPRGNKLLWQLV